MCHRLYDAEWRAEEEARRRAAEQQAKPRGESDRQEPRREASPQKQEERRVEAEVE